ncbi:MAG: LamB/YcsF family protein [Actinomycetota bacterium]|nr:LamB/YcsF family protein [Actinomycetota bacterium]
MAPVIDLNADVGEGFGAWRMADDDGLLDVVTSANVACGFHAGDPSIMRRVCSRAAERGVIVGAHVSFRDLMGFGRRPMQMAPDDLADDIAYQLGGLAAVARASGSAVRYVKAHGALYNQAADDRGIAEVIAAAVASFEPGLAVLCLPGSAMDSAATAAGLRPVAEGYLDRSYDDRARLVPRSRKGAVITDSDAVVARAVALATHAPVQSVDGNDVTVDVRSLCTHGDTPAALDLARAARRALEGAGVTLRSFVAAPD